MQGMRFNIHVTKLNPMNKLNRNNLIALWLLSALFLGLQSCDDGSAQFQKSKVQFVLSPGTNSNGRMKSIDLPENASARISIESNSGTPILFDHEIKVLKVGDVYVTDPLDLLPGSYVITDFVVMKDSEVLNAAPKEESHFSSFVRHSLPYNFSVTDNAISNVSMQVLNARKEKPEAFGYVSFKLSTVNKLSFIVTNAGGHAALRQAVAELRQGKNLIKEFAVKPGMNSVDFQGEPDATYSLYIYAAETAKVKTFNLKRLKQELGPKPLKLALEPALMLTLESGFEPGNDYEEFFEFMLAGTGGTVNVNWGDGFENTYTLPFDDAREYTTGTYTAVVTGDLDRITNLHGFAYSTIINAITGLTNLTGLKTYNPSWGAVPIKVNLSNCKMLETIYIEKYGAPYEPIDLRTDFLLPDEHFIREFVFFVPSLDPTRANISAEELEVLVDNIYNNTTRRDIRGGNFFVYPVDTPLPETQRKLDILQSDYSWNVSLDGNIWGDGSETGRTRNDLEVRRENWLRDKFPNRKDHSSSAKVQFAN